jgi:tRNA A37 threonylcarbamoyladenosine synthetase subunit TsaC/SUA5/YrdC
MPGLDIRTDAALAFGVLRSGGIAILPMDVGYSLIGGSTASLDRIFAAKQRGPSKINAMLGDDELTREIHVLTPRQRDIVNAITLDHGLPLGLIGPARMDHPHFHALDERGVSRSTRDGTVCMLLNAGSFHAEICRLSRVHRHVLFGSSANRSLQGTKFCVEEIEPEIRSIANCIIDHGLRKYHLYRASSTLIDVTTMRVVRVGSCYELIADVLKRWFKIELPARPVESAPQGLMSLESSQTTGEKQ